MYTRWTKHLSTEEEKLNFRREVYSAKRVLERLKAIVEEDEQGLALSEIRPEAYMTPNWEYHQAHKNGVRQYIHQIKTLVDLDQQKGPQNNE